MCSRDVGSQGKIGSLLLPYMLSAAAQVDIAEAEPTCDQHLGANIEAALDLVAAMLDESRQCNLTVEFSRGGWGEVSSAALGALVLNATNTT